MIETRGGQLEVFYGGGGVPVWRVDAEGPLWSRCLDVRGLGYTLRYSSIDIPYPSTPYRLPICIGKSVVQKDPDKM